MGPLAAFALKAAPFALSLGSQLYGQHAAGSAEDEQKKQLKKTQREQEFLNAMATLRRIAPQQAASGPYAPSGEQMGRQQTAGMLSSLASLAPLFMGTDFYKNLGKKPSAFDTVIPFNPDAQSLPPDYRSLVIPRAGFREPYA